MSGWVGARLARKEDPPLLTGNARFIDDLSPVPGIRHVALLRAPHAHARIKCIDVSGARAIDGVGVVTGADLAAVVKPIASAIRAPVTYYPMAVEKVRFAGEPVALVAAADRYLAEDALEAIRIDYEPLEPVVDPRAALADAAPLVHEAAGTNLVHERRFRYGDPERAFAAADRVVSLAWRYPRQSCTPIETCGAIAQYEAHPDRYTIWSNFQGPFILHSLMSASLGVPGNRLRLVTAPYSGGSFGIKQSMFPTMILLAAASRLLGAPLKWIEDRLESLQASSCAADRADEVEGAFTKDGALIGLRYRNLMNAGAYVRAPEPASLYRMHAAANGCYRVRDIEIDNRVVVTNLPPVGLNRGYGGPQFYYALERLMEAAARALGIDPAELRRRNLIAADAFPYEAPAGAVYDSGDYEKALDQALALAGYDSLVAEREKARAAGRLYGIGMALGVEPSGSNMAYVTLAQTPEERARAGGRSGGPGAATVSFDPSGALTVRTVSTPAGQGHATAAAQIVADALGVHPDDVTVVTEADTLTADWSLASGNYSNRFAAVVVGAIAEASRRIAARLKRIAGDMLEVAPEDIELADGHARIVGVPGGVPIRRVAARAHWHPLGLPAGEPAMLRETAVVSPPLGAPDDADRVSSAVTFGFVCDLASVEIDRHTGRLTVHKYATVHDCGTVLNPLLVEGQVHGGFAHGLGAALFEELVHDDAGTFLSGSFADYLCPTAPEVPPLASGLCVTPSPRNALGSKGMGDGSAMLAPAVLANAVADALGRDDIEVPLTLNRMWALANGRPFARRLGRRVEGLRPGALAGDGSVAIAAPAEEVWRCLLDAEALARMLPGCRRLERSGDARFSAEVLIGVAGISGVYDAEIELRDLQPPRGLRLVGRARGAMGWGTGEAEVALVPGAEGTVLSYRYAADVGGKVAAVGQRMLATVTRALIARFFAALARELRPRPPWWKVLRR